MSYPYLVMVEGRVYITGTTASGEYTSCVLEYEPRDDKWIKLEYQYERFAMVALNDKLTVVGGTEKFTGWATNQIAVWEKKGESHEWTHPYPPMLTRRSSPTVAAYNEWLVVAGGRYDGGSKELAAVELLNVHSKEWLSTTPLPVKCSFVTAAIVQDELFLVGGTLTTQTLAVSLPDLTQSGANSTVPWRTLSAPPLEFSAAINLRGALLAIGGRLNNQYNTAIHVYQPATNDWSKVGDLPHATERAGCACTLLSSGELLVAGGVESSGHRSKRVDVAALY